ncbi:probable receptor-like protein kinase At5g24010 [Fagus crenata]
MLHSHKILFQLFLLLPLHFSSLLLPSSAYTVPDKYFINCGAGFNTTIDDGRVFVGDQNSCSFSTGKSEHVMSSNSSIGIPLLYQTARVYRQPCSYKFEINQNGTYIVRLHFFVFLSPANVSANLSDALFNVLASGFSLLMNFSIRNSSSSPVIKEFLLNIAEGEFKIHFIPSQESSLAFINAIEVFLAPEAFLHVSAPHVTSAGDEGTYSGMYSHALHTIYRINVGGPIIEHDELWRKWKPDDSYLFNPPKAAKNVSYIGTLNYQPEHVTKYIAPALVYQTARLLNIDDSSTFLNLTWRFPINKNATHLVRVHFCDIVSKPTTGLWFPSDLWFNLSIYSNFGKKIHPYNITQQVVAPFYFDFVVVPDDSGFINVSLVPRQDSPLHYAFLNGLEIMEFMKESSPTPKECESMNYSCKTKESGSTPKECESKNYSCKTKESKKNCPTVIIVLISSGAFFILVVVVVLGLKCKKGEADQSSGVLLYGGTSFNKKLTERNANASLPSTLNLSLRISLAEIKTLQFTEKSDVYSFGVVLLELLCARPAVDNSLQAEEVSLAEWGMLWLGKGQLENIIDPVLVGKIKPSSLKKFGEIAEKCLKADTAERPDMHEVLWDLACALQLQEIAINREPHEDSLTNTSLELQLPVWHLPSTRILNEEEDTSNTASEV